MLLSVRWVGHAQILLVENEQLTTLIKQSEKKYKLLYVFCDYCQPSVERFPRLVERLKDNRLVDFFPICAQDSADVNSFIKNHPVKSVFYIINSNRKRKIIDLYNPIKATCKYLTKELNVRTKEMGASDVCILNEKNEVVWQSNWEMSDAEYWAGIENNCMQ